MDKLNKQALALQDNTIYFHSMLGCAWGKLIKHNKNEVIVRIYPVNTLSVFTPQEIAQWTIEGLIVPIRIEKE